MQTKAWCRAWGMRACAASLCLIPSLVCNRRVSRPIHYVHIHGG